MEMTNKEKTSTNTNTMMNWNKNRNKKKYETNPEPQTLNPKWWPTTSGHLLWLKKGGRLCPDAVRIQAHLCK